MGMQADWLIPVCCTLAVRCTKKKITGLHHRDKWKHLSHEPSLTSLLTALSLYKAVQENLPLKPLLCVRQGCASPVSHETGCLCSDLAVPMDRMTGCSCPFFVTFDPMVLLLSSLFFLRRSLLLSTCRCSSHLHSCFSFLSFLFSFCPDILFPRTESLLKPGFHDLRKNSKAGMKFCLLTHNLFSLAFALFLFWPVTNNRCRNKNNQRSKTIKEQEFLHLKSLKIFWHVGLNKG